MAQQDKTTYEGTFNNTSTGLFKNNTTNDIEAVDLRTFVTNTKESVPFTLNDSYTWPFPQVTASGTNTYAATVSPAIVAYATGQKFQIKFTNASSGVSTLNIAAIGAKKIFVNPTTQVTTGDIVAGQISILVYDATLDASVGGFLMMGGVFKAYVDEQHYITKFQTAHALTVGMLISTDDSGDLEWDEVTSGALWPLAQVTAVPDANNFTARLLHSIITGTGFTMSARYYLQSDGSLGTTVTEKIIGVAVSTTQIVIIAGTNESLFKGYHTSEANLEAAYPTGIDGSYAIVDAGIGTDAVIFIWDNNTEGWIQGGGVVPYATDTVRGIAKLYTDVSAQNTDGAPDQNAVFDALALKANITYVDAQVATKYDFLVSLRTLTASHTLDSTDLASVNAGDQLVIQQNVASANNLEIPLNSTIAFPVGTIIGVRNINTGVVTITAVGGVTLTSPLSAFKLANQWDMAYIEKTATNTWVANGQLSL